MGMGVGVGGRAHGRGTWTGTWTGTWAWGLGDMAAADSLDSTRLDSTFSASCFHQAPTSLPPSGPMFQFQFQGRGTWPGRGRAPTMYNRDTWRSRWRRGTLPSTAQDHISQMTAPPSQPARACWAQHACLVLSCLAGPGAVPQLSYRPPSSGPRQAPACIHLLPT